MALVPTRQPYRPARLQGVMARIRAPWFNEEQGWWLDQQPIEPIFCQGLIKTIQEAIDNPIVVEDPTSKERRQRVLPIDSYWIASSSRFEMTVCRSPQQVTLLLMTPPPPVRQPGIWGEEAPVWAVRRDTVYGDAVDVQPITPQDIQEGRVESDHTE